MTGPDCDGRRRRSGVFGWRPAGRVRRRALGRAGREPVVSAIADELRSVRGPDRRRRVGLLRAFNRAGVLSAADVHVARRLGRLGASATRRCCWRSRWPSARRGSATCTSTSSRSAARPRSRPRTRSTWGAAVARARAVARRGRRQPAGRRPADDRGRAPRPPRRCGWSARGCTSTATGPRRSRSPRACGDAARRRRPTSTRRALRRRARAAVRRRGRRRPGAAPPPTAVRRRFAVVAGGPGTGKTTTVARIVALLGEQSPRRARR